MPKPRDLSMLQVNTRSFLLAMAESELEPKKLAEIAGVSPNIVYAARKGCYIKPCYLGKIAKAMNVKVIDLIV